jgi:hypothetical protein
MLPTIVSHLLLICVVDVVLVFVLVVDNNWSEEKYQ